jgi:integrase
MPRKAIGLTARQVATIGAPGLHAAGGAPCLYLQVTHGGRSWVFRYKLAGKRRDMGLGPLDAIGLAEARQRAVDARKMVLTGTDPIEARRTERATMALSAATAMTFKQCADAYITAHRAGWKNAVHAKQWPSTLEAYVYPVFGSLPVQAVDVGLVMKVIEPIWSTKPETASRVRGRVESILDWATSRGYRRGENPARWRGHLENLLPKASKVRRVAHHAALPYADIAAFMTELRQQDGVAARALEFAILSAARTGEVLGARWPEINVGERLWTIPAERMKAGKEHRVPLSDAALAIIEAMSAIRSGDFVFPGASAGKPLSNMSMLMLLRRMGQGDLTVHGFRSCFRDWAAERTTFPSEVAEMALAHVVSDKVEAAYRRGDLFDKRRQIMDTWARYVDGIAEGSGTVVDMALQRAAAQG